MFYRVDPSRSAGTDFFVLDQDASLPALQSRDDLPCASGGHRKLKSASIVATQSVTCNDTPMGGTIFTIIYSAQ